MSHQGLSHQNSVVPAFAGNSSYHQILEEVCRELKIELTWVSNHWVAILEKNGQKRFILGYKFDLNPAVSTLIADDKFATFEVLRRSNIPIIEHAILYVYDENNSGAYAQSYQSQSYIEKFLTENQNHIVIKPNNGYCGYNVYQVQNMEQAEQATKQIFQHNESASMCPFYDIKFEYRFIMLDGKVRLAYKKEHGEDWRFNLKQGAKASPIENAELYNKLHKIALRAVQATNMRFCSVDIIETTAGELLVMEINAGVMTEGYLTQHPDMYLTIKQIYADAIRKMFSEN